MAYDRKRKTEIDAMGVADLIHTMLVEFDPAARQYNDEPGYPWQQSAAYTWAHERLNEILPIESMDETIASASDAADAAAHGF